MMNVFYLQNNHLNAIISDHLLLLPHTKNPWRQHAIFLFICDVLCLSCHKNSLFILEVQHNQTMSTWWLVLIIFLGYSSLSSLPTQVFIPWNFSSVISISTFSPVCQTMYWRLSVIFALDCLCLSSMSIALYLFNYLILPSISSISSALFIFIPSVRGRER